MRKMEDVGVKGWRKWQLALQVPGREKEQRTEEADVKCFHTVFVHLNALVRLERRDRQDRDGHKESWNIWKVSGTSSPVSWVMMASAWPDVIWADMSLYLEQNFLVLFLYNNFDFVNQSLRCFEEFACGLLVKSSFICELCLRPPGGSEVEWTVGRAITSSSLSFCWGSWRRLGCYLPNAPMQRIPRERTWQVDHRWQIKAQSVAYRNFSIILLLNAIWACHLDETFKHYRPCRSARREISAAGLFCA